MARRQDEFERVAMPHTPSLLRLARRLMPDAASAEDLVQDTMLAAWRGFGKFRPGSNIRAWLFRILMNAFHARARKRRPAILAMDNIVLEKVPLERDVPSSSESAEVHRAFGQLTVEHRTVLLLAIIEGFTCQETADILALPIGTVMSRLNRARRSLRERMVPKCIKQEAS